MRVWWALTALNLSFARHIAGADLYYTCTDSAQNRYAFELWLYRDCTDPQGADYDNPITIYIFYGDGTLYTTQTVNLSQFGPWDPAGVDACFLQRPGTCLEEGVYRFNLTLPPQASGYYVAWARCCRNATITNLQDPLNMGITYLTRIPPARRASCNTSPKFVQRPPFFLCVGSDFYFDHSAIDADGDSLVYTIVPAYHSVNNQGQGAVNPIFGGSPAVGPHNPLGPPPYQYVTYAPGYSATQPFGAGGICQIDPQTGLLHLRAPNPGLYVVAIALQEYRNGQFLGETRRDMQFYVAPCRPPSPPPLLSYDLSSVPHRSDTITIEAGLPFCFTATLTDTAAPLNPPAVLSYSFSPGYFAVQASGTNPLFLQICGQMLCQDTGQVIPLYLLGRKTETCGTTEVRETLWVVVQAPPPRSLSVELTPPPFPQNQGVYIVPLDSLACAEFRVLATPPQPPSTFSVQSSPPSASVGVQTQWRGDTLVGKVCYRGGCEAFSAPVLLTMEAQATALCPPSPQWRDTLRFQVPVPQNPPPQLQILAPETLQVQPESLLCLRVRITDEPPPSQHTLYVQAFPPLLQEVSLNPSAGSLTWEAQLCLRPSCEALNQTLLVIVEVRDSLGCAELHRVRDTISLQVVSRPTAPLVLYTPSWSVDSPFVPLLQQRYCFQVSLKDTAGNGGSYNLESSAPFGLELISTGNLGDSVYAVFCFQLACDIPPDSLYPIVVRGSNRPVCANAPPDVRDTLWVRPQNLPQNRPPTIQRDRPSPWNVSISGDSLCYLLAIQDPDSVALLSYSLEGEAFSPDFYYGSHFTATSWGTNPLYVRLCAQLNCYAQGLTFPAIVCALDTTSCDPAERWRVCDTLWIQTQLCHGLMPNVFTPNGDGINDFALPYQLSGIASWRLQVWDRWGRLVFAGREQEAWDGRTPNGEAAIEGTYFYLLELRLLSGTGPEWTFQRTGSLTLLR